MDDVRFWLICFPTRVRLIFPQNELPKLVISVSLYISNLGIAILGNFSQVNGLIVLIPISTKESCINTFLGEIDIHGFSS
jgi:hypothetical protein